MLSSGGGLLGSTLDAGTGWWPPSSCRVEIVTREGRGKLVSFWRFPNFPAPPGAGDAMWLGGEGEERWRGGRGRDTRGRGRCGHGGGSASSRGGERGDCWRHNPIEEI